MADVVGPPFPLLDVKRRTDTIHVSDSVNLMVEGL